MDRLLETVFAIFALVVLACLPSISTAAACDNDAAPSAELQDETSLLQTHVRLEIGHQPTLEQVPAGPPDTAATAASLGAPVNGEQIVTVTMPPLATDPNQPVIEQLMNLRTAGNEQYWLKDQKAMQTMQAAQQASQVAAMYATNAHANTSQQWMKAMQLAPNTMTAAQTKSRADQAAAIAEASVVEVWVTNWAEVAEATNATYAMELFQGFSMGGAIQMEAANKIKDILNHKLKNQTTIPPTTAAPGVQYVTVPASTPAPNQGAVTIGPLGATVGPTTAPVSIVDEVNELKRQVNDMSARAQQVGGPQGPPMPPPGALR